MWKSFKCEYCPQYFKVEQSLKYHKKTVHNVIITKDGTELMVAKDVDLLKGEDFEDDGNDDNAIRIMIN